MSSRPYQPLTEAERIDWLRLIRTEHVGPVTFNRLLKRYGTAAAALAAVPQLARQGGRGHVRLPSATEAADEIARLARAGGRLLFSAQLSNEVVAHKRNESTVFFAMLLGQHAGDALQLPAGDRRRASTHFAVGGVGQTLSAWLSGEITFTPDELVDHLALMLDTLGKRAVRR